MFSHLTLPTQRVEETCLFLSKTLGYRIKPIPANAPVPGCWFDLGNGQEMHIIYVEDFVVSPFENEFGRHVALFHPVADFPALRERILAAGGELVEPLRSTPFQRLIFRDPINGYLFEMVDEDRHRQLIAEK